jgi:hypothetical protein
MGLGSSLGDLFSNVWDFLDRDRAPEQATTIRSSVGRAAKAAVPSASSPVDSSNQTRQAYQARLVADNSGEPAATEPASTEAVAPAPVAAPAKPIGCSKDALNVLDNNIAVAQSAGNAGEAAAATKKKEDFLETMRLAIDGKVEELQTEKEIAALNVELKNDLRCTYINEELYDYAMVKIEEKALEIADASSPTALAPEAPPAEGEEHGWFRPKKWLGLLSDEEQLKEWRNEQLSFLRQVPGLKEAGDKISQVLNTTLNNAETEAFVAKHEPGSVPSRGLSGAKGAVGENWAEVTAAVFRTVWNEAIRPPQWRGQVEREVSRQEVQRASMLAFDTKTIPWEVLAQPDGREYTKAVLKGLTRDEPSAASAIDAAFAEGGDVGKLFKTLSEEGGPLTLEKIDALVVLQKTRAAADEAVNVSSGLADNGPLEAAFDGTAITVGKVLSINSPLNTWAGTVIGLGGTGAAFRLVRLFDNVPLVGKVIRPVIKAGDELATGFDRRFLQIEKRVVGEVTPAVTRPAHTAFGIDVPEEVITPATRAPDTVTYEPNKVGKWAIPLRQAIAEHTFWGGTLPWWGGRQAAIRNVLPVTTLHGTHRALSFTSAQEGLAMRKEALKSAEEYLKLPSNEQDDAHQLRSATTLGATPPPTYQPWFGLNKGVYDEMMRKGRERYNSPKGWNTGLDSATSDASTAPITATNVGGVTVNIYADGGLATTTTAEALSRADNAKGKNAARIYAQEVDVLLYGTSTSYQAVNYSLEAQYGENPIGQTEPAFNAKGQPVVRIGIRGYLEDPEVGKNIEIIKQKATKQGVDVEFVYDQGGVAALFPVPLAGTSPTPPASPDSVLTRRQSSVSQG